MKGFSIVSFSTFLALLSISNSYALQTIGQVVWVKGAVKATQPQQAERNLSRRSSVYEKDTLTTDATGSGQIVFSDNSTLSLRENTSLNLAQYKYGKGTPPKQSAFVANLAKGGFRTITGAIAKDNPSGYEAKTPVAIIGVVGTGFDFVYNPSNHNLGVNCQVGTCSLTNSNGKLLLNKDHPYATVTCTERNNAPLSCQPPTSVKSLPPELTSTPKLIGATFSPAGGAGPSGPGPGGLTESFKINMCP